MSTKRDILRAVSQTAVHLLAFRDFSRSHTHSLSLFLPDERMLFYFIQCLCYLFRLHRFFFVRGCDGIVVDFHLRRIFGILAFRIIFRVFEYFVSCLSANAYFVMHHSCLANDHHFIWCMTRFFFCLSSKHTYKYWHASTRVSFSFHTNSSPSSL